MQKKSILSRSYWVVLIAGFVTGMGNGSVFGAALMCWMGRGDMQDWGGIGAGSYIPTTFNGLMTFWMLVFGAAFTVMLAIALKRHNVIEQRPQAGTRGSIR